MEIPKLKELVKKSLSDLKQLCRQYEIQVKGRKKATYAEALINNEYYCLESTILAGENTCKGWHTILRMKTEQITTYALKFNIVRRVTCTATGVVKEHLSKFKSRVYKHMKWLANFNQHCNQASFMFLQDSTYKNIFDIEVNGAKFLERITNFFTTALRAVHEDYLDEYMANHIPCLDDPHSTHDILVHYLDAALLIGVIVRDNKAREYLCDFWNTQLQPALLNPPAPAPVTVNYTPAQLNAMAAACSGDDLPW